MKIRKGDKVQILLGKDRGKTGTVDRVFVKKGEVLVGGLNIYKKHVKPRGERSKANSGIIDYPQPLAVSKMALICPHCGKISRIGFKLVAKKKVRICRLCKTEI